MKWDRRLFSKQEEVELRAAARRVLGSNPEPEKLWRVPDGPVMPCIICGSGLTVDGRYCSMHKE